MSFPKYKDLLSFSTIDQIDQEIFSLRKTLFELKLKSIRRQIVTNHICRHTKHRIAQLKFKKSLLEKSQ